MKPSQGDFPDIAVLEKPNYRAITQDAQHLKSNLLPNNTLKIAYRSDQTQSKA